MKIDCICKICGSEFKEYQVRIEQGRGKFCSKLCVYKSRKGRPAWNKGKAAPWNKGNKYRLGKSNPNPHTMKSEDNPKWKGDKVGYRALHYWVERQLGKPKNCEHCGDSKKRMHWANKSGQYSRDIKDWLRLCPKCHKIFDSK